MMFVSTTIHVPHLAKLSLPSILSRRGAAPMCKEGQYYALVQLQGELWQDLHHHGGPARRAAVVGELATAIRDTVPLIPYQRFTDGWKVMAAAAYEVVVLDLYQATETALTCGEWNPPPVPEGSITVHHPKAVDAWVELADTADRRRRADLLAGLAEVLEAEQHSPYAAEALRALAVTEVRLARTVPARRWWPRR
jgi:hypothetical protein